MGLLHFVIFSGFLDEPRNEGSLTAPSSHFQSLRTIPSLRPLRTVLLGNDRINLQREYTAYQSFKISRSAHPTLSSKIRPTSSFYPVNTRQINQPQSTFNIFYSNPSTHLDRACFNRSTPYSQLPSQTPVVSQNPSHLPIIPIPLSLVDYYIVPSPTSCLCRLSRN